MRKIRFCEKCGVYTLGEKCMVCGSATVINAPMKYSLDPSVSKYRRIAKKSEMERLTGKRP